MIKVDSNFIPQYIAKIEKECMFEGIKHDSSLTANLIPILELFWDNYQILLMIPQKEKEIIKILITMDSSKTLFESNINFLFLRKIVELEYEFENAEVEDASFLERVWKAYLKNPKSEIHIDMLNGIQ
jgi:hypothetical protein